MERDYQIFGSTVRIRTDCSIADGLVQANYAAFLRRRSWRRPALSFAVERQQDGWTISSASQAPQHAVSRYKLLYLLEKMLTIELQLLLPEFFFVHGAALAVGGRACILAAPPGSGKSTTTWGLVHEGFDYLSDELAPIDLARHRIVPFPHAICLKNEPPGPYPLPAETVRTEHTMHVPAATIPSVAKREAELGALVFNSFEPDLASAKLCELSPGEASARLYANGLNQLAHDNDGLAAAAELASSTPAYTLQTTRDLSQAAALLRELLCA